MKNKFYNACGWTGGVMLAFCGVPEVIVTIERGTCDLSWGFIFMWLFGEILLLIPIITTIKSKFLIFNYTTNIAIGLILVWYKIFGG